MEKVANATCDGNGYQVYESNGELIVYRNDWGGQSPVGRADTKTEAVNLIQQDANWGDVKYSELDD